MIYAFEGYELDRGVCELRHSGRPVPLEPQALEVLAHLVENRDRVVAKDELLDAVWGTRFVGESALTTRIKEIRRALGDSGREQRLVRTLIGRGYRFAGEVAVTIRGGRGDPSTDDRAAAPRPSPPPVGRDGEIESLEALFSEAVAWRRRVVLLSGEAGSGKTTLLEALASRVGRTTAAWVATGQSLEHTGPGEPWGCLLDALSRLARGPGGAEIVGVLRRRAPAWLLQLPGLVDARDAERLRELTLGITAERMRREILEALEELSAGRPLLLMLEDLHWSDTGTLEVVAALARRTAPARLMAVGTYRVGGAGVEPVAALAAELAPRRPTCHLMEIDALGIDAVSELLCTRLGGIAPPPALAEVAIARGGGNPLFTISLLDHWRSAGLLRIADGCVVLPMGIDALETAVSRDLRGLIRHQLSGLDTRSREVLEAASVAGPAAPTAAVAAAIDAEEEEVEARLADLAERTTVLTAAAPERWPDGTTTAVFGFRHSLFRQVLHDGLGVRRRARLHARVGARLAAAFTGRPDLRAGEVARHFVESGEAGEAVPWLVAAAEGALGRSGHAEAVELLGEARGLVASLDGDDERVQWEATILALLGPALIAVRGWAAPEVREAYERALGLCRLRPDRTPLGDVLYGLATLHEYRAEYDMSKALMEQRFRLHAAGTPAAQVESHELLACSSFHQGGFDEAIEHAERALDAYSDEHVGLMSMYGENPAVSSRHWAAHALWFLGYPDRALRRMEEALDLAREIAHAFSLAHAHEHAAHLHQYRLEPERVRFHAEATTRLAHRQGYAYRMATGTMLRGWAVAAGDVEAGLEELTRGLEAYRATGAAMDLPYFLALLADVAVRAGRHDAASAALDEARTVPRGRAYFYEPELLRLRAELLHRLGHRRAAVEAGRRAIEAARSLGARSLQLRAAMSALVHVAEGEGRDAFLAEVRDVHDAFTEGFSTPDLRRARALLGIEAPEPT